MIIIRNNFIPFGGFRAINLFGILFLRSGKRVDEVLIRHEQIHTAQMRDLLYVFFYPWYIFEWLIRLPSGDAYRNISFEREAYTNEDNPEYLNERKQFSWMRYLQN